MVLGACQSAPEIQTVEVTRIVEIPVTEISEVEVTRIVPLTRLVPVIFEVTTEKEIEVTRMVDKVVIVAPTPNPTSIRTPTIPASVTDDEDNEPDLPAPLGSQLLATMINVRDNIQSYGFHIDSGLANGFLNCPAIIAVHDSVAAAPTYDVSASGPTVQGSFNSYQNAVSIFVQGVNPLTQNCRENPSNSICIGPNQARGCNGFIPEFQWSTARAKVIEAENSLSAAITNLDQEFDVPN